MNGIENIENLQERILIKNKTENMPLNNFFRINLPYGLLKDNQDNWSCFNRKSQPLSCNSVPSEFSTDEAEKYRHRRD